MNPRPHRLRKSFITIVVVLVSLLAACATAPDPVPVIADEPVAEQAQVERTAEDQEVATVDDPVDEEPNVPDEPALPAEPVFVPDALAVATRTRVFLSRDRGITWTERQPLPQINRSVYLTSATTNPHDPDTVLLGTSFKGIYESTDWGVSWTQITTPRSFSKLYQGAGFFDEVTALAVDPDDPDVFYYRIGFAGGVFRHSRSAASSVEVNVDAYEFLGQDFRSTSRLVPVLNPGWPSPDEADLPGLVDPDLDKQRRLERASDRRSLFLNHNMINNDLAGHLTTAKEAGLNAIVIDLKDEFGRITFSTDNADIRRVGAVSAFFDLEEVNKAAHDAGFYVIGRVVSFKDARFYQFDDQAHALWDRTTDKAWGVWRTRNGTTTQIEHWVDPYDPDVRKYLGAIALESQELGVDEIQFDYIRFPSDGNAWDFYSRYRQRQGLGIYDSIDGRVVALRTFLSEMRDLLDVPIGVDVFGFNSWARMGYLGQDIEAFAEVVDVISPMNYPSHFSTNFLPEMSYLDRAQYLYDEGSRRARDITLDQVIIRPYVQAFLVGDERNYDRETYVDYLNRQIRGLVKGGASGFSLWNMSGSYYMIDPESFKAAQRGE